MPFSSIQVIQVLKQCRARIPWMEKRLSNLFLWDTALCIYPQQWCVTVISFYILLLSSGLHFDPLVAVKVCNFIRTILINSSLWLPLTLEHDLKVILSLLTLNLARLLLRRMQRFYLVSFSSKGYSCLCYTFGPKQDLVLLSSSSSCIQFLSKYGEVDERQIVF